jgi:hypothetical protein
LNDVKLGQLAEKTGVRDAVHVAIVSATASGVLMPGQWVRIEGEHARASIPADAHGIVDPYLRTPVDSDQCCYVCLVPGLVTGMRHQWECDAIDAEKKNMLKEDAVAWIGRFAWLLMVENVGTHAAALCHADAYQTMMYHIDKWLATGLPFVENGSDRMRDLWHQHQQDFWPRWSLVTGRPIPSDAADSSPYSCSC